MLELEMVIVSVTSRHLKIIFCQVHKSTPSLPPAGRQVTSCRDVLATFGSITGVLDQGGEELELGVGVGRMGRGTLGSPEQAMQMGVTT